MAYRHANSSRESLPQRPNWSQRNATTGYTGKLSTNYQFIIDWIDVSKGHF